MQQDPVVGTWKLNPTRSQFDPNHRPSEATMSFHLEPDGEYVLLAEGVANGKPCTEGPQRFRTDEKPYPAADLPGLTVVGSRPAPDTIRVDLRREDGSLAGQATYAVSADGRSLAATTTGFDSQLRQFRQYTVWDRV